MALFIRLVSGNSLHSRNNCQLILKSAQNTNKTMITETPASWQSELTDWQEELRQAIRNPIQLLKLLELSDSELAKSIVVKKHFALQVPKTYVARMRKGKPDDPLLRQVLPMVDENLKLSRFKIDPVGDVAAEKVPGLLHKYQGRVLLLITGACAIHCRYCFRQHYNYAIPKSLSQALDAICADSSISEVILSGGEPLLLTDNYLEQLARKIANISHIRRLRLHTRLPIVLPTRVNNTLLTWLTGTRLQPIVVIHTNHANEIDETVIHALQKLTSAGIMVLNQSVLLRGVNDNAATLSALSETLFSHQVLPYYLHFLDQVQGAAHFEVSVDKATQIIEQLRINLPGYLVPKLVREVASMAYKQPL